MRLRPRCPDPRISRRSRWPALVRPPRRRLIPMRRLIVPSGPLTRRPRRSLTDEIVEFRYDKRRNYELPVVVIIDDAGHGLMVWFAGLKYASRALVSTITSRRSRPGARQYAEQSSRNWSTGPPLARGFVPPTPARIDSRMTSASETPALLCGVLHRCFEVPRQVDRRLLHDCMVPPLVPYATNRSDSAEDQAGASPRIPLFSRRRARTACRRPAACSRAPPRSDMAPWVRDDRRSAPRRRPWPSGRRRRRRRSGRRPRASATAAAPCSRIWCCT